MLRKIRNVLLSYVFCLILLTGCNPMSREISGSSQDWESILAELKEMPPNELPEHLDAEVSEYLKIDAVIETYSELTEYAAPNVELSLHIYDQQETVNILLKYMGNPEVVEWKEVVKDDEFYADGTPVSFYQASFGNDNIVQARDFYFLAWNNEGSAFCDMYGVHNYAAFFNHSLNRIEDYANDTDLNFAKRADVDTQLEQCLNELGIEYTPWEQHICTSQDIIEMAEDFEEQYKDSEFYISLLHTDIREEDGVYIRTYLQRYGGIPVIPYNINSTEVTGLPSYYCTYACAIYGHDGIEDFRADGAFDYVGTKDAQGLITFGDALELFVNERAGSAVVEQYTLKRAGLYYLPQLTQLEGYLFEAKPVWVFVCDYEEAYEGRPRYMTIYDAVTGEKIL